MPVSGTSWNLLLDFPKSMGPPMPPIGEPGPPWPPERRKRRKSPANATSGNNRLPRRPTKFPCCSPSETEMSTPFLARMSTNSGSLGSVTVALLPSTAVSCRENYNITSRTMIRILQDLKYALTVFNVGVNRSKQATHFCTDNCDYQFASELWHIQLVQSSIKLQSQPVKHHKIRSANRRLWLCNWKGVCEYTCRMEPSLLNRTRSTLPAWTALMNSLYLHWFPSGNWKSDPLFTAGASLEEGNSMLPDWALWSCWICSVCTTTRIIYSSVYLKVSLKADILNCWHLSCERIHVGPFSWILKSWLFIAGLVRSRWKVKGLLYLFTVPRWLMVLWTHSGLVKFGSADLIAGNSIQKVS